jgi:DNA-binding transcriptional LysR family regulator
LAEKRVVPPSTTIVVLDLGDDHMLDLGDLTTLALFAEVAELRSFTAAATASGMAKATVSRRIAELEQRLGVRLLRRTTRQVTLTEEGKRLYERCAELVATAKDATEILHEARERPAGVLRVAAPIVFAHEHLTAAVVDFLKQHPDVQLQLLPRSSPADLVAEEIDVAVRVGKPKESSWVARRLATDRVVVVGSNEYFRRHGTPEKLEDLERHSCLRFSWEAEHPRWRFRGGQGRTSLELRGNLVASDATVVREAAILGLGLACLPSHVVAQDVRSGRLLRVLENSRLPELPISVVHVGRRNLAARVRVFVDFLVARFANRAWRERALL